MNLPGLTPRELRQGWEALFFLFITPLCVAMISWLSGRTSLEIAAFTLGGVLLSPLFYALLTRRQINPLSCLVVFIVLIVLGYLLPLPSFLEGLDRASIFVGYGYVDKDGAITTALWLTAGGCLAFIIPQVCFRREQSTSPLVEAEPTLEWNPQKLYQVGLLYTVVSLGMFVIGVIIVGGPSALIAAQSDRLRAFSGINFLLYAIQLMPIFALLWWMWLLSEKRRPGIGFCAYSLFSLALCLFQGSKLVVLLTLMTALYLWHTSIRPIKARWLAIAGVLGLLGASGYDLYFREYTVNQAINSMDLNVPLPEQAWLLINHELGGQFMQLQMLSILVDATPDLFEYEHGATFIHAVTFIVPRALWPDKPTTNAGRFAETLRPDIVDGGTTFPPSMMGEFYWNFGHLGVIVGMLIVGWVYRLAEEWMVAHPKDPRIALPCAFFWALLMIGVRGSVPDIIAQGVFFLLPAYLAANYAVRVRVPPTLRLNP